MDLLGRLGVDDCAVQLNDLTLKTDLIYDDVSDIKYKLSNIERSFSNIEKILGEINEQLKNRN